MKTAIVTDSTAYIPKEIREKLHIHMIPLSVVMKGETYEEEVDLFADQFFEEIKNLETLPTSSQPSTGRFVELFESLAKDYDEIISIHLSSGISGTFQGAVTAGTMVEGVKVYPYDSEISCMAQGFYAIDAAKMALEGKTTEEILQRLDELKASTRAYFMADDLSHLQRGGRLSSAQALIGSLLKIKPLLHFVDKKIAPFEKIRTRKKAMNRIGELIGEDAAKGTPLKASIIHANREEEAKEWKSELEQLYPNVDFSISYFGPVIATHIGEGGMGLTWMLK
ncbi:DegV family protein [Bacillus sp. FJAT-49736]|uniref:DegV family protein n=1 Tax=Bacillus sp. FJAT-49736 TaxID=2833582 RepID=UPI001BC9A38A|nr:DegV family protein [Bacillus sp. FJAT-49736]MBS4174170.1 DegV family protein [Bacillus sp. FJAT-49736]